MKRIFIKCESCSADVPAEGCELSTYRTVIDGKEYVFCCRQCAKRYSERKSEKRAKKKS